MAVYKEKNNTYKVCYNRTTKRGFKSKKEALKYEKALKEGLLDSSKLLTFDDIAKQYLSRKKEDYSYGTYTKKIGIYENILQKCFDTKLFFESITQNHCNSFRTAVSLMEFSTTYKNTILDQFKAIFIYAEKYCDVVNNSYKCIDKFRESFEDKQKKRMRQKNVWSEEEFMKFLECVTVRPYDLLFVLLYYTGMRKGEALALTWYDFDDKLHLIDINKNLTNKTEKQGYEIKEPKTAFSTRKIGIGENVSVLISQYKNSEMKKEGFREDWFIFGGIKPLATTTIDRIKDKAIEQAKVRRIRLHDFRHSHASNLINNNQNIVSVSRRLGHSSIDMTLNTYTHLLDINNKKITDYIDTTSENVVKMLSA